MLPVHRPAPISTVIVTAVRTITQAVRDLARECLAAVDFIGKTFPFIVGAVGFPHKRGRCKMT